MLKKIMRFSNFIRYPFFLFLFIFMTSCGSPADQRPLPLGYSKTAKPGFALPLDGAHNFRDLGGYPTADGKQVKWGLLFRSSRLSSLNSEDRKYLNRLQVGTVFDFRTLEEKEEKPDQLPKNGSIDYIELPINPGNNTHEYIKKEIEKADNSGQSMVNFMTKLNRELVTDFTPVYRKWLHMLANGDGQPIVFHCTAGKDRAGFASTVLLLALGVSQEIVMEDYLLSNQYSQDYLRSTLLKFKIFTLFQYDDALLKPLLEVRRDYLSAAFDQITKDYGSIDNYLATGLGLTDELKKKLRLLYLVP